MVLPFGQPRPFFEEEKPPDELELELEPEEPEFLRTCLKPLWRRMPWRACAAAWSKESQAASEAPKKVSAASVKSFIVRRGVSETSRM